MVFCSFFALLNISLSCFLFAVSFTIRNIEEIKFRLNLPANYTFTLAHSNGIRHYIWLQGLLYIISNEEIKMLKDFGYKLELKFIDYRDRVGLESMTFSSLVQEEKKRCEIVLQHDKIPENLYQKFRHAQDAEDIWLYENAFYGIRNGVIIESGALNGVLFSTSYLFEQYAGWKAIHIEADLKNFYALIRNRPTSTNINVAFCQKEQDVHYISDHGQVSGIYEFATDQYRRSWWSSIVANETILNDVPVIKCKPPRDIFSMLGIKRGFLDIDIWILDIEGAELEALHGTDFDAVSIKYISMECDGTHRDIEKVTVLKSKGFTCKQVLRNCMCQHDTFVPSIKPSSS